MSASMSPTRWPCRASATAKLAETVDFPTPPLPDEIASTLPRFGSSTGVGGGGTAPGAGRVPSCRDRKSTRLNSSHGYISYAVFCLKKKKKLDSTTTDYTLVCV